MLRKRAIRKAVPAAPSAAETATLDLIRQWAADGSLDVTDIARTLSLPVFRALIDRGEAALGGDGGLAKGPHSAFGPQEGGKFLEWLKDTTDTLRGSWWSRAEKPIFNAIPSPFMGFSSKTGILLPSGHVVLQPENSTSVSIFDPVSNSLSEVDANAPGNYSYSASVLLPDGRVFFAGSGGHFKSPAIFNPIDNSLTDIEINFPSPWDGFETYWEALGACHLLPDGRVFVLCIRYDGETKKLAYIYDASTGLVSFPPLPWTTDDDSWGCSVLLPDGRLVLYNPRYDSQIASEFCIVNIASSTITRVPMGRFNVDITSMVLLPSGKILCVPFYSFSNSPGGTENFSFLLFDPSNGQISEIAVNIDGNSSFPEGFNNWISAILLPTGYILLSGFFANLVPGILVFNPETGTALPVEYNGITYQFHSGTVLLDGRIFMYSINSDHYGLMSGFPRPPADLCLHPNYNKGRFYL